VERLGIIGGGQLGRFLTLAAGELGVETIVVDTTPDCPASAVGARQIVADYDDPEAVRHLTRLVPVVTFEIERGPLDVLRTAPCRVVPAVETLALLKDKLRQRTTLAAAGLANPTFAAVHTLEEALAFGETVGYPLVIKRPQGGYDGRGIAFLESPAALIAWWRARPAGWTPPLLAEEQVDLARELAVMVVRAADGTCACYPVVETVQREGLCRRVIAPAPVSPAVVERVRTGLLELAQTGRGKEVLRQLYQIDGLAEARDSDYDGLRRKAQILGFSFEQALQPAPTPVATPTPAARY